MNNPFFVLTSNENEIIGIIRNRGVKIGEPSMEQRIITALEHHYDCKVTNLQIPDEWETYGKPVDLSAELADSNGTGPISFTITMAWDY